MKSHLIRERLKSTSLHDIEKAENWYQMLEKWKVLLNETKIPMNFSNESIEYWVIDERNGAAFGYELM